MTLEEKMYMRISHNGKGVYMFTPSGKKVIYGSVAAVRKLLDREYTFATFTIEPARTKQSKLPVEFKSGDELNAD